MELHQIIHHYLDHPLDAKEVDNKYRAYIQAMNGYLRGTLLREEYLQAAGDWKTIPFIRLPNKHALYESLLMLHFEPNEAKAVTQEEVQHLQALERNDLSDAFFKLIIARYADSPPDLYEIITSASAEFPHHLPDDEIRRIFVEFLSAPDNPSPDDLAMLDGVPNSVPCRS